MPTLASPHVAPLLLCCVMHQLCLYWCSVQWFVSVLFVSRCCRRTDDSRLSTTVDVCRSPPCVQPNLHPACGGYFSHGQLGHTSQRRFHSLDQRLHTPIVSSGHVRSASIVLSNVWRDGCVPSSLGGRQHYNRRILSSLSSCKRYTERRCTVQVCLMGCRYDEISEFDYLICILPVSKLRSRMIR